MKKDNFWLSVFLVFVLLMTFVGHWTYSAYQAKIWQKQGIDISTIEVFFGMKPAGTPSK